MSEFTKQGMELTLQSLTAINDEPHIMESFLKTLSEDEKNLLITHLAGFTNGMVKAHAAVINMDFDDTYEAMLQAVEGVDDDGN